jgi:hypothetical protein
MGLIWGSLNNIASAVHGRYSNIDMPTIELAVMLSSTTIICSTLILSFVFLSGIDDIISYRLYYLLRKMPAPPPPAPTAPDQTPVKPSTQPNEVHEPVPPAAPKKKQSMRKSKSQPELIIPVAPPVPSAPAPVPPVKVLEPEFNKATEPPPSGKKTGIANPDFLKYFHANKVQFKNDNPTVNQFAARAELYRIWKTSN